MSMFLVDGKRRNLPLSDENNQTSDAEPNVVNIVLVWL